MHTYLSAAVKMVYQHHTCWLHTSTNRTNPKKDGIKKRKLWPLWISIVLLVLEVLHTGCATCKCWFLILDLFSLFSCFSFAAKYFLNIRILGYSFCYTLINRRLSISGDKLFSLCSNTLYHKSSRVQKISPKWSKDHPQN